ncbi:cytochrome P450 1A5-like [Saccoglossus kowalevskii]|uniref:Cytochrome P450 1A5-like n=1 Tax=Saccoglossus kowalevskii TaxID=10224 RepID=A0ABM0GI79_SACKO|nr:PREDICTED: cytochrome P450 1A5-like [Saccoglossus kowalevskii]
MITYILHNIFDILNTPTNVILLLLVFIITYGLFSLRKPSGFPPGPMGYPFIGNMIEVDNEPLVTLAKYGKKYGDVFTIKIGSQPVIVLNTVDVIKEALVKKQNDFAGRPYYYSLSGLMAEECEDITFGNYSAKWKLQRKIGHQAIRNYASGDKLESLIRYDAFPSFQRAVARENGKPFRPHSLIYLLVGNIILSMCLGKKFENDDPEFLKILEVLNNLDQAIGNGLVADFVPIFRYIPTPGVNRLKKVLKEWFNLIQNQVNESKGKFDSGNNDVKSLIDDLLSIQRKAELAGEDLAKQLTDVNLRQTLADLVGGGLDITISLLDWAVAFLTYYPDVQFKVQSEIDDVIGDGRLPLLSDKGKLPYCEAVIRELLRIRPVVPLSVPHATTVDTSVGGYVVPKDTWIWCNLWNVHMNEKHWDKPEEFRPERFLDADGALLPHPDSFMPFSAGRRVCMGEALAKNELFLIFTSLFQNYTFKVPPGSKKPCLKGHCAGLVMRCVSYEVIAIERRK